MAVAALYAYWRLRPYIKAARQLFGAARGTWRVGVRPGDETAMPTHAERRPAEQLVRCDSCGTWLPASRAVALGGSGAQFCSHACLETAAGDHARARKSAS